MGPYCRAIQHFVIAMAIISSLRGSLTVQGEVVRWVRALPSQTMELWFEPHWQLFFLFFFSMVAHQI